MPESKSKYESGDDFEKYISDSAETMWKALHDGYWRSDPCKIAKATLDAFYDINKKDSKTMVALLEKLILKFKKETTELIKNTRSKRYDSRENLLLY